MKIYTKTGDSGETSLFGGRRVSKSDLQVEAYGSIDELQAFLSLATLKIEDKKEQEFFITIAKDLYKIMAILSGAKNQLIDEQDAIKLEKYSDDVENKLPKLTEFIIPVGTELSSLFNICRTVCRRSERAVLRFFNEPITNYQLLISKYLNRLSDLLFIASRKHNTQKELIA